MTPSIIPRRARAGDLQGDVHTLAVGKAIAEVWLFLGFNCLRWSVDDHEMFYVAPDWESNPVPTRSGHPILFPFPNRLKDGRFWFAGREYQLPLNESSGLHAIHGFTPKSAWRWLDHGVGRDHAWIRGEFCLSKDRPDAVVCWPADARIRVTYTLTAHALKVESAIDTADRRAMPFGLGFHPYFTMEGALDSWKLQTRATSLWDMEGSFPIGMKSPLPPPLDFRREKPIGSVVLDTLFGDLDGGIPALATLDDGHRRLTITADKSFTELLLFTPPHRHAVAIEPYTCSTDAANLQARGIEAGWRVLPAGETYTSVVEYRVSGAADER